VGTLIKVLAVTPLIMQVLATYAAFKERSHMMLVEEYANGGLEAVLGG
jgi:hypothetical protein